MPFATSTVTIVSNPDSQEPSYELVDNTEERASELGCTMVLPNYNQLQLDIDTELQYRTFKVRLAQIKWSSPHLVYSIEEHASRRGYPHRHITLTFENYMFDQTTRVAWQLTLGSDPVREALGMLRIIMGHANPSCLFEPVPQPTGATPQPLFGEMLF